MHIAVGRIMYIFHKI